ncbi:hypothetical protein PENSPDRAFT_693364 [Peniophora sp. CONT]|nr:hypothetical protein PENSPDRAFT_693364 [Peniophora sp. CONT]
METHSLRDLVVEDPQRPLLDAIDSRQDCEVILPLLEVELQRSSARLQRLKEYRNSLASPMYCLQPEILSKIFFMCALDYNELFDLRWTRLLLVCKRWYDNAKDVQILWSFIDVTTSRPTGYHPTGAGGTDELDARDIRRVETQRSRAGLSPLTIQTYVHEPISEAKLPYTTMFWEPVRIYSLNITGGCSYVDDIVRSMATHRHPHLESLAILCQSRPMPGFVGIRDNLNIALRDHVPSLRHLSLSGLSFDFTLLHGLRSLCFADYGVEQVAYSLQDIITALGHCPQLEILNIVLSHNSQPDAALSSDTVPMTYLRTITVYSTLLICTNLLQALADVPSSARIFLATGHIDEVSSISMLMSYLGDHASRENALPIRAIAVSLLALPPQIFPEPGGDIPEAASRILLGVVAQRWPSRIGSGSRENYRRQFIDEGAESSYISILMEVLAPASHEFLTKILSFWHLSKATHLDLRSAAITSQHISILLANLPVVTAIIIRPDDPNAQILLASLRVYLREHGRRAIAHVVFDAQELNHHATLTTWGGVAIPSSEVLSRRSLMCMLAYCAEAARVGVPLDTVEIINEPHELRRRILGRAGEFGWSELYSDLQSGFVYEGVLHSGRQDLDGTIRDSFTVADV